jgi:hypothetical protein
MIRGNKNLTPSTFYLLRTLHPLSIWRGAAVSPNIGESVGEVVKSRGMTNW